jgi:predicted ABC-type ATPase
MNPSQDRPLLVIIAGANGSGKSTITDRLRQSAGFPVNYVNPDKIALTLTSISDPVDRVYTAAKIADKQREELLNLRQSLAFETVMSHPSKIEFMARSQAAGYQVLLVFVGLADPELCVRRVSQRVLSGGHDVPRQKIIDRYHRVMALLPQAIASADRSLLFDNSDDVNGAVLVAEFRAKCLVYRVPDLPKWVNYYPDRA